MGLMASVKDVSNALDSLGETALKIKGERDEAQLQLVILLDYLDKFRADRCRCENNGDLCEFCSMLYDAKLATKGMEL